MWKFLCPIFDRYIDSQLARLPMAIFHPYSVNRKKWNLDLFEMKIKGSPDQSLLFLKSMSETGGSDIEQLLNWMISFDFMSI